MRASLIKCRPRRAGRRGRAVTIGAFAAVLVVGTVAAAQRSHERPQHGPAAAAPTASASPPPPPSNATDAGPVPSPYAASELGDGGKLSPLNPAPNEFSDAGQVPASIDYDRLLSDLASLRARAAAVSDVLFHSRLAVSIETSGDHGRITALSIGLDDGNVWTSPPTFRASDATTVYDHAVAPGHHAVTVDVERHDDRNDTFRSSQRSRFLVDVPADGRLSLEIKLWDDSSMGGSFPSDRKGQYDLRVRATAKAEPLAQGK